MKPQQPLIIFDFGNVLLDIDYKLTLNQLSKLCDRDWQSSGIPEHILQWMRDLETGSMRPETFLWHFQFHFDAELNPRDIIKAWNALLLGIPNSRFNFLKKLKKTYKVALLSNTNQIHLDWVHRHLRKKHDLELEEFETICFDKVYYSHKLGHRKPEQSIYLHVQKELDVNPKTIIFIDDLLDNVEAARKCGWYAIHHDPKNNIESKLKEYIQSWQEQLSE
jgi:putative hydrolase of the HAD superfamily